MDKKNEQDQFKEFLDLYQIYRDHVKHEDDLGNQRLNFFIASQSILFFPYFEVLKEFGSKEYQPYDLCLLILICILGLIISCLTEASVRGFVDASSAIALIWKKKYLPRQVRISLKDYKYVPQAKDIKPIDSIEDKDKLSFLVINNQTFPNIRYENPSENLNWRIKFFSNNLPYWFMAIWGFLLALSVWGFYCKPFCPDCIL